MVGVRVAVLVLEAVRVGVRVLTGLVGVKVLSGFVCVGGGSVVFTGGGAKVAEAVNAPETMVEMEVGLTVGSWGRLHPVSIKANRMRMDNDCFMAVLSIPCLSGECYKDDYTHIRNP